MSKKSLFICQQCGYESTGWLGKCPGCGEWNSLVETIVADSKKSKSQKSRSSNNLKPVSLWSVKSKSKKRISTKISELDRVLGGGIVAGQVVLIAGEPGVGKSTILMQLSEKLGNILYVSGEESVQQIAIRGQRLGINKKSIQLLEETDIDSIVSLLNQNFLDGQKPQAVIIDSIQTMSTGDLRGMSGSAGQVRECSSRLVRLAKQTDIPIFIVGHVTKQGSVAGPALLMHIVDTVLWFEGSKDLSFRLLRARKNRFGPTDEVGIFSMDDKGLTSIEDASGLFLSDKTNAIPGSCVTSVMEGTRPILVEIQSLVVRTKMAFPKRVAQGMDVKRVELLLAVLQRRAGLPMNDFDVFVNVVSGIRVREPGVDLAVCMSIASAYFDKALPKRLVAIGEVGLLGEVRPVASQTKRIKEAKRLGYKNLVTGKEVGYIKVGIGKYFKKG